MVDVEILSGKAGISDRFPIRAKLALLQIGWFLQSGCFQIQCRASQATEFVPQQGPAFIDHVSQESGLNIAP
jgi:hypothetical protein